MPDLITTSPTAWEVMSPNSKEISQIIQEHAIKQGSAKSMTVKLLRDVLDEMGVYHNKTMKKAVLVQKVKDARRRKTAIEATMSTVQCQRDQNHEKAKLQSNYTHYNLSCSPLYYYENERKLFYNILLAHVIFLLELIAPHLAVLQYMYVAYFLHLVSMAVFQKMIYVIDITVFVVISKCITCKSKSAPIFSRYTCI